MTPATIGKDPCHVSFSDILTVCDPHLRASVLAKYHAMNSLINKVVANNSQDAEFCVYLLLMLKKEFTQRINNFDTVHKNDKIVTPSFISHFHCCVQANIKEQIERIKKCPKPAN
jgi:hypothetical protein